LTQRASCLRTGKAVPLQGATRTGGGGGSAWLKPGSGDAVACAGQRAALGGLPQSRGEVQVGGRNAAQGRYAGLHISGCWRKTPVIREVLKRGGATRIANQGKQPA